MNESTDKTQIRVLTLFSGGLDSILAARVLMNQGLEVLALRFVTPFFDGDVGDPAAYAAWVRRKYGIAVQVVDLSREYLHMLRAPAHGFGRNFNPCIDCKILMLRRARELMAEFGAVCIATGEVLGQRPMSQRRDTLRIIEKESGCEGLLLRPLCARHLPATLVEEQGLVDRERLLGLSGRGRTEQQRLAAGYGIRDYPNPAGGCLLTDVNLNPRFRRFAPGIFALPDADAQVNSFRLLLVGRHFAPGPDLWFVLGRKQADNERIAALRLPGDVLVRTVDRPGPLGLLRCLPVVSEDASPAEALSETALDALLAGLILRYAKKVNNEAPPGRVRFEADHEAREECFAPLAEEEVVAPV